MAELILGRQPFSGSHEQAVFRAIVDKMGMPTVADWPALKSMPLWGDPVIQAYVPSRGLSNCSSTKTFRGKIVERIGEGGWELLSSLLKFDPAKRLSAVEAMNHKWLENCATRLQVENIPSENRHVYSARKARGAEKGGRTQISHQTMKRLKVRSFNASRDAFSVQRNPPLITQDSKEPTQPLIVSKDKFVTTDNQKKKAISSDSPPTPPGAPPAPEIAPVPAPPPPPPPPPSGGFSDKPPSPRTPDPSKDDPEEGEIKDHPPLAPSSPRHPRDRSSSLQGKKRGESRPDPSSISKDRSSISKDGSSLTHRRDSRRNFDSTSPGRKKLNQGDRERDDRVDRGCRNNRDRTNRRRSNRRLDYSPRNNIGGRSSRLVYRRSQSPSFRERRDSRGKDRELTRSPSMSQVHKKLRFHDEMDRQQTRKKKVVIEAEVPKFQFYHSST
eukprot:GHVP01007141.1.p1 GENE.GHVP01007141.1~~GHVP01007141.1.p1  ORF type:complete len:442 (-),score=76.29 GHVP01007141.1:1039-2364(-)